MPALLAEALRRIGDMEVDLLAVTGDLVDVPLWLMQPVAGFTCDDAGPWREAALADYRLCRQLLDASGLRYVVLPGNHDDEDLLWQVFERGDDAVEISGCRVVRFCDREHDGHAPRRFVPDRLRWDAELARRDDGVQVHLQHYVIAPDLNGDPLKDYPHTYAEGAFLADAMTRSPHVRLSLSGHYHAGHATIRRGNTWFATAPAFSDAPFRWRIYELDAPRVATAEHALGPDAAGRQSVVFVDRDGVVTDAPSFCAGPDAMQINASAAAAIRRINDAGRAVVVISNQTSVGWGLYPDAMMHAASDRMCRLLVEQAGAHVDAIYTATGAADRAVLPRYADASRAKPSPAMLLEAAAQLNLDLTGAWMVGDNLVDVQAASAAGVRPMVVRTGNGRNTEADMRVYPDVPVVDDLGAAVEHILGNDR